MSSPEQQVRSTCEAWLEAIRNLDFDATAQLWDAEFDGLLYQPEELGEPMTTHAELVEYWAWVPGHVESVPRWHAESVEVQVLGGVAMVWLKLDTSIKLKGYDQTFDGVVRCSLGLREAAAGWKLIHYHESRIVSLEEVQTALAAGTA
jgi:ketosteroid isomerase-like protein